jgi:hypothetical protein
VLKKLFKAVVTFSLVVGCYFGYIRVFAIVVQQFTAVSNTGKALFVAHDSNSRRISIAFAKAAFGAGHWSTALDLGYRYYNADRGYYMYAQEAIKIDEEDGVRYDGKRIRLKPFAMLIKSRDGKNTKTITSEEAVIDLNEPLSFNVTSGGEALKLKHAHLERNVQCRDDKSTPDEPDDDMTIDPMTTLDYDEPTQQITTDSHVVIRDPDMVTSGDGMVIQLRKDEKLRPAGSSGGFDGAERIDLNKNVHVVMRDVGKSGLMPGLAVPQATGNGASSGLVIAGSSAAVMARFGGKPTPLDVRCDWKMQAFLPKPKVPVVVGPPEPPAPTLVQFDRNVVLLRGDLDKRPDQLTCDSLKLTLVPGDKPLPPKAKPSDQPKVVSTAFLDDEKSRSSEPSAGQAPAQNAGLFGNLNLQRAHATGHAVWLSLPTQGVKLRCNELIHTKLAPYKPDRTYFRGDLTRPLELEKIDVVENEGDPDQGEVTSVTHIWAVDATMFDSGNKMDAADVVANGPGRLETRPGRDQPVERIAIWQDKFYLQNEVSTDGRILHKQIVLTGKRPCFIDQAKKSSLDSAQLIRVWLKPKPKSATAPIDQPSMAGDAGPSLVGAQQVLASSTQSPAAPADAKNAAVGKDRTRSGAGLGGGNFAIERLVALRDVHLLAPARTMNARAWLDAEFINPEPSPKPASSDTDTNAAADSTATNLASNSPASNAEQAKKPESAPLQTEQQKPPEGVLEKPPAEPAMIGSAERMWVRMEMKPAKGTTRSKPVKGTPESESDEETGASSASSAKTASSKSTTPETNAEIRNAWLWGSVSLHEDAAEGQTKGQEASGEAIYVDNQGEGKVVSYIYQREPNEKTYLPGPLPPARVENEDKIIKAAGVIRMNQATDQAWVHGAGTLTQLTERQPDAPPAASTRPQLPVATATGTGRLSPAASPRTTSLVSRSSDPASAAITDARATRSAKGEGNTDSRKQAANPKPKTRAGVPLSKIITTTIQFSEEMEFTGRTVDPMGNPAACADFHGVVTALMEDALLHCEERMITYTDRVVPLAQLGAMSKKRSRTKPGMSDVQPDADSAAAPADEQPQPQLALIECYRNAVLINREVDPDLPILVQKKRVEAEEVLFYDRRSGDFTIPGKGKVYLYDRSDNSGAPGSKSDGDKKTSLSPGPGGGTVTSASRRIPSRTGSGRNSTPSSRDSESSSVRPKKSIEPKAEEIPSLVLTQITFIKGMRSQPGTGGEEDQRETHWYEFFGDVQLGRAKVLDGRSILDFDKLPSDAVFLTGQTLRFITEPPPVGSPAAAPGRDYGKAWENAFFRSTDKAYLADMITADVITYDSEKDQIYAYGEGGRGITYAQQHADGQPASSGTAKALRFYPKSGAMELVDNTSIQLIDKNTGVRPKAAEAFDNDVKTKKPPRKGYRIPSNNMERRGFTGQ